MLYSISDNDMDHLNERHGLHFMHDIEELAWQIILQHVPCSVPVMFTVVLTCMQTLAVGVTAYTYAKLQKMVLIAAADTMLTCM